MLVWLWFFLGAVFDVVVGWGGFCGGCLFFGGLRCVLAGVLCGVIGCFVLLLGFLGVGFVGGVVWCWVCVFFVVWVWLVFWCVCWWCLLGFAGGVRFFRCWVVVLFCIVLVVCGFGWLFSFVIGFGIVCCRWWVFVCCLVFVFGFGFLRVVVLFCSVFLGCVCWLGFV